MARYTEHPEVRAARSAADEAREIWVRARAAHHRGEGSEAEERLARAVSAQAQIDHAHARALYEAH